MTEAYLRGVAYSMGECILDYHELPEYSKVMASCKYPEAPEYFGWGKCHRTERPDELIRKTIQETLEKSHVLVKDIGLVVFAFSDFAERFQTQNTCLGKVLENLGFEQVEVMGVTLSGCASGIHGLIHATRLVQAGTFDNVLVVFADTVGASNARFTESAVFSDASASALVSSVACDGGRIAKTLSAACPRKMSKAKQITENEVAGASDIKSEFTLDKLMSNNIFLPIKKTSDFRFVVHKNQLYLRNIERLGHCITCDPLINLHDYLEDSGSENKLIGLLGESIGHYSLAIIDY